jgi:phosphatidylglycerophosphate synthase
MANLNTAAEVPDWELIPEEDWNVWQKLASRTDGNLTPGNVFSVIGGGLVLWGINDARRGKKVSASAKIAAGRVCDIYDGKFADWTGTKSPKGEALDATIDKVEMAAALLLLTNKDLIPKATAARIGAQNVANVALTAVAKARGVKIHPGWFGKRATAGQWATIGLHGLAGLSEDHGIHTLADGLVGEADTAEVVATFLGTAATAELAISAFARDEAVAEQIFMPDAA